MAEATCAATLGFLSKLAQVINAELEKLDQAQAGEMSEEEAIDEFQMLSYFAAKPEEGN